ncbi:hypothetical protein [Armatimonas sp.]|uniref:hypothetical protein n=1 Tax=Armatimonas sp. TaxID=1872638 RepID=UPI0037533B48
MEEKSLSVAEFDARLQQATERLRMQTDEHEARNTALEALISQKEVLAQRLEALWREMQQVDSEIARLRPVH